MSLSIVDSQLIDLLPVAVYVCEAPSGVIKRYNRKAAELWGCEPKRDDTEKRFSGAFRLYYPNGSLMAHCHTPMVEVLRDGMPVHNREAMIERPDGSRITVLVNIDPIKDETGVTVGTVNVFQDISDRKRVEAELQESEERLRLALYASGMGTWDWNIQTGRIQWSENLETLFGLERGEFDGSFEMFVARLHPADRQRVLAAVDRAIATKEDYEIEFRVVYPNGTIRWAQSQGKVFYDQNGQPMRMAGIDIDITERKRAEVALRESEQRYATLAQISPVGIFRTNVHGDCLYTNARWCELAGLTAEEAQGKGWLKALHPDDRERVYAQWYRAAESNVPFWSEYRFQTAEGVVSWLIGQAIAERDTEGNLLGYVGTITDISERQQTEAALRENEQRLRLALTGAEAGLWDWEIQTDKIVWSPENYYLYGLAPTNGSLRYEDWYNALHPEERERVNTEVASVVEQRRPEFQAEFRIVHPQRGIRWILALGRLTLNEQGEPIRLSGINLDITVRKIAESVLRQSEEFKRLMLESSSDCIKLLDPEGKLLYVNARGRCLLEIDDITPYINTDWICFWQQGDRSAAQTAFAVAKTGELSRFQSFCPTAKGTPKWWDVVIAPILNSAGQVTQLLATSRDITAGKQAEIERERLLKQEQAARAEAERANRVKDEFLAILSHELRSPLNPILGWAKLMQTRSFAPTKMAQALATIERNAKLQCQLIDDLLDVAKILRGKLSMNVAPVNLVFVIEAALDTVRTAAVAKSILLHPVLPQIGQVCGDSARLQQIVWNLLSNAIKFTPTGGRVDIRLSRVGNLAQITVSDTGKGIKPDFVPHIFESFRQEDVSTTRKYGGLGLGLAIVQHLVEAHGGTIWADSPGEGQGATFTVRLPLLALEPKSDETDEFSEPEPDLTTIRVLVVDDEPDSRELFAALLSQYGAEVLSVASAAEVLASLESFQPDVLVSDIGMP
ncbi:MAG TPA: hypothetical protein DEV81_22425, partial [Cyanobacteria bacterium UBA11049]|nr:hypothetical protein [Cyanobacteria bacterium UBA11049]